MANDPYSNGFAAGISGEGENPHRAYSVDWLFWHAGEFAGHQTACTQLEFILLNFPQD